MTLRELRPVVLKMLRAGAAGNQLLEVLRYVQRAVGVQRLEAMDQARVLDIMWELVTERVIAPGVNEANPDLPFFHLTDHGRKVLREQEFEFLPYDPDGYLLRLNERVPKLDDIARVYVEEGLAAYRHGLPRACAVMLGAAAEQIFLTVSDALVPVLAPDDRTRYEKATRRLSVMQHLDEFNKRFDPMRKEFDAWARERDKGDLDWERIFDLIRNTRNDAGHPKRPDVSMEDAFEALVLFPRYCERAMALAKFFRTKAGEGQAE